MEEALAHAYGQTQGEQIGQVEGGQQANTQILILAGSIEIEHQYIPACSAWWALVVVR